MSATRTCATICVLLIYICVQRNALGEIQNICQLKSVDSKKQAIGYELTIFLTNRPEGVCTTSTFTSQDYTACEKTSDTQEMLKILLERARQEGALPFSLEQTLHNYCSQRLRDAAITLSPNSAMGFTLRWPDNPHASGTGSKPTPYADYLFKQSAIIAQTSFGQQQQQVVSFPLQIEEAGSVGKRSKGLRLCALHIRLGFLCLAENGMTISTGTDKVRNVTSTPGEPTIFTMDGRDATDLSQRLDLPFLEPSPGIRSYLLQRYTSEGAPRIYATGILDSWRAEDGSLCQVQSNAAIDLFGGDTAWQALSPFEQEKREACATALLNATTEVPALQPPKGAVPRQVWCDIESYLRGPQVGRWILITPPRLVPEVCGKDVAVGRAFQCLE